MTYMVMRIGELVCKILDMIMV